MLWRAPWLSTRIALMCFAAWDAASLYLSYNLTYLLRLNRWEGWNAGLAVITATWLTFSYLIGRYSPDKGEGKTVLDRHMKTGMAGSAIIAIFVAHSWLYQVVDAQTRFRGFLIPAVLGACALSTIGQTLSRERKRQEWLICCNNDEARIISSELSKEQEERRRSSKIAIYGEIGSSGTGRADSVDQGFAVGDLDGCDDREIINSLLKRKEQGQSVIPLMSWCEHELQRIPPELVHPEWLAKAEGFNLRRGSISWRVKRLGDIAGASMLIVATAPLVLIGGLLVWIEDHGPILYNQIRSGLYGKPIRIWKLRSMKVDSEHNGAQWASRKDKRITRVGKILRATRIDELPQLWSVLSGDLSLIGPRPERPEIEIGLEKCVPNYRLRHWVRPGLSGWAQVCYPYGASVEDSRMKLSYDIYYLRNVSVFLDILITMKTIRLVAGAKGSSPKEKADGFREIGRD